MSNPIADLTYRTYEGPINENHPRWLAIAIFNAKRHLSNKFLWVLSFLCLWYYLVMIVLMFVQQQFLAATPQGQEFFAELIKRINWKDQFLLGFSYSQLLYFVMAMILGSGAVASDNRANALLVYLSKTCTKTDYIFGKWLSVAGPIFIVQYVGTLIFWSYGMSSFGEFGFQKQAGWMVLQMIPVHLMSAALHASLIVGVSSLFDQPRLASATYTALYMLTNFFTQFAVISIGTQLESRGDRIANVESFLLKAYYWSIDGIQIGMAKVMLNTAGQVGFGAPSNRPMVPIPPAPMVIIAWAALCVIGLFLAVRRVRAVEVVG